jgi:hypothetical protein
MVSEVLSFSCERESWNGHEVALSTTDPQSPVMLEEWKE